MPDHWSFYKNLNSFSDFNKINDDSFFQPVPEDWIVVLTDVRGSTKAVQDGHYKQVNTIGAASIACIINVLKTNDFPFVFGGDGATMLLPKDLLKVAQSELLKLQALSLKEFNLELRVGIVAVKNLYKEGLSLKIGKYTLSDGNYLAQFRGTALTRAEDMVKNNLPGALILNPNEDEDLPALEGLSCRLDPLKSKKGKIVSILVKPTDAKTADIVLRGFMQKLLIILNNDFKSASPVEDSKLKWKWIPDTFKDENKLKKNQSFLKQLFMLLLQNASLKLNFPLGVFDPSKYKAELVKNSDFKKFDETLRMVIDCTDQQVAEIEKLLKKQYEDKQIFYGIHKSAEALMTCVVFSATNNQHIHFIDGGNGGYVMAASEMKKQMAL